MSTQKTAMMQLRDRLQEKINELNKKTPSHMDSHTYWLEEFLDLIDTELLSIEKQQMIDFGNSCIRNVEY